MQYHHYLGALVLICAVGQVMTIQLYIKTEGVYQPYLDVSPAHMEALEKNIRRKRTLVNYGEPCIIEDYSHSDCNLVCTDPEVIPGICEEVFGGYLYCRNALSGVMEYGCDNGL